jgi:WD40 repeat protein
LPKEGFISSCDDNSVKIWTYNNVINEFEVTQLLDGHENGVTCAIELDNGDISSGSNDMCINVWRIPENGDGVYYECVQPIGGISEVMSLCGFKGKVVAGFKDATIKVFENVNGVYNEIAELSGDNGHKKVINMIIKLKDDRLASCSFDKYIKVWSYNEITKQFGCDQTIRGHMMAVYAITETKDGKMVSVSGDKNVIVWKRERKI